MDIYIGTILPWAGYYEPQGFLFCNGQILQISQYNALYAVIGNYYGGSSGQQTFALPDLRGCFPIGAGQDKLKNTWTIGQTAAKSTKVVLQQQNLPAHTHNISNSIVDNGTSMNLNLNIAIPVNTSAGTDDNPGPDPITQNKKILAASKMKTTAAAIATYSQGSPTSGATLQPFSVQQNVNLPTPNINVNSTAAQVGGNVPLDVTPPFTCINFIIAFEGLFPPRNNQA
ncbi:tail fiber protein [Clostridium felsineum]|uniref:phage tail protein n=1 Tax=Clostridium felsineum TaxID=36839 RepID=UPI00098BEA14|nr:tail fiber protein [Clostridium felsineum]MCR3760659.1 tail fiber protein [Clostridium felsineum]URZ18650.1 hypothetical protein CLFE_047380 [Clostridium felsineum DSM 794]